MDTPFPTRVPLPTGIPRPRVVGALAVLAMAVPLTAGCGPEEGEKHAEKLEQCDRAPDNTELGHMVSSRDAEDRPVPTLDELVAQAEGIAVVHTGRVWPGEQTESGLGGGEVSTAVTARVLRSVKGDRSRHTEMELHYDFLGLGARDVEEAMPSQVLVFWTEVPGTSPADPLEAAVPAHGFLYEVKEVTHEEDNPCTFRVRTPRGPLPEEFASLEELEQAIRDRVE